jgi:hypothetical protein
MDQIVIAATYAVVFFGRSGFEIVLTLAIAESTAYYPRPLTPFELIATY